MPILRIVGDRKLSQAEVNQVKVLGSILGYSIPYYIWVETSGDLTQPDVMMVTVTCEKKDFERPQFGEFCRAVGSYLRVATDKSVEVVRPINGGIESVSWHPTEEGKQRYSGSQ